MRIFVLGAWLTAFIFFAGLTVAEVQVSVAIEEEVYSFVSPNNGSGPLWCFGSTQIARLGEEVYVSQMETGEDVPLLCNTRWRLLRRMENGWEMLAEDDRYRQREPCPVTVIPPRDLYLYVNDSIEPPGTKYGRCDPYLWQFSFGGEDAPRREALKPVWRGEVNYTDHSYRGFAADATARRMLMLNIDAKTSVLNACMMSETGETLAQGAASYPIRSCYPQVMILGDAVHILAIGDIVEPVQEWREYKFAQSGREWDYVFRRLFYTFSSNLRLQDFGQPLEIANVDDTCGHISNQDLWVAPDGTAYILYTQREVQSAVMRDKFFPDKSIINDLNLAVVLPGKTPEIRTLIRGRDGAEPGNARFQVTPDGALFAILYMSGPEAGNKLLRILPQAENPELIPIPLSRPMGAFCLATVRAGNAPSWIIDLLGHVTGDHLSYARINLEAATK